jgi:hypothetical protein
MAARQSGLGPPKEMTAGRQGRAFAFGALFVAALALAGCSTTVADMPGVAPPADAPARPQEAGAYPPVNDLPPDRDQAVLDPAQRDKIEKELIAARDRQASTTPAASDAPATAKPPVPVRQSAKSRRSSTSGRNASAQASDAQASAAQASAAK